MKSNLLKSIFVSLILVMGVSNAWAYNISANTYFYYDNSTLNWTNSCIQLMVGHNTWSQGYQMTKISNTNLYYVKMPKWDDATHIAVFGTDAVWGGEGSSISSRKSWAPNSTSVLNLTANLSGSRLLTVNSSATLSNSSLASYTALNSQQTINTVVDGSDANSKATISLTSYKMTGNGQVTEQTATLGTGAKDSYITAARTATTTLTVGDVEAGYQFDGWYTAATGGTQLETKKTYTYYPTAATTVYARFSTKQHTVLFDVHSSGHGSLTAKVGNTSITSGDKVNYGSTIVFTAKPADGYQIEGWYKNSDCTTSLNNGTLDTYSVTVTTGTNVYVKFEAIPANSHNITYTAEGTGWTYGNSNPTTAEEGATVTFVVNPTAGYRVDVSSDGPAPTGPNANNQYTFTMPNKDVKISVEAKPEQYTITLNNQGATTAGTTSVRATYNAAMSSITIPTKTGYTFGGYYTATNGGGTQYYKADGTSATAWTETSVTELYAKWTANTYSITYKDQNNAAFSGTHTSGYPTTHTYGTATTLKTASKTGYTFDGWFTTSDCSGTAVTSLGATTYTSDITLYAKWTEIPPTTVYLKPNNNWKQANARFAVYCWNNEGNIWYDMTKMDCDGGDYYMVEIPVAYKDFKFVRLNPATTENNWDDGTKWNETGNLNVPTDSKVLFTVTDWGSGSWGTYSAPQYAITITNGTGGTVTVKQGANTITSGNKVNLNAVITATLAANDGYSKGTAKIKIGDNAEADLVEGQEYTICGPTTITAEFESNIRTVSFDANGHGTEPEEQTINSGEKATEPAPLTEEGYTFGGWYTEKECTTQFDFNTEITENITLYAKWTEILSTITIKTNPEEGGRIEVDGQPFTPGNTVKVGVTTTCTVTTKANEGYGVIEWGVSDKNIVIINGGHTITLNSDGSGRDGTLTARYTPISRNIQFDKQGGEDGTETATVTYTQNNYDPAPVDAPTRAGYTFGGYYSEEKGEGVQVVSAEGQWLANATDYTNADGNWLKSAENTTLYAHWIGAPYTVELNQDGAAKKGSTTSVVANFEGNMPAITGDGALPTPPNGYAFMGYFDQKDGKGTQYYNSIGTSANMWDKAEDATLYAYFAKAKITTINLDKTTFEPVEAGSTGFVIATPIVEPKPTGTTTICWRLLYSNGSEVEGRTATQVEGNKIKFSIAGLSSGNYKIEAVLRTGNNCGSGTELSTKTVNFTIASTYTITVKYTCDGKEIMAPTKIPAHVTEETEITAPDITGYTFSSWEAGDGVTIKSTNGNSVKITAFYDGYLTAKYTARPMVYFKNTLGWEKVYVYTFSNNAWWNDNGQGVHPATNSLEQGEMKLVEGTDDIFYFELTKTDDDYTQDNNANPNYIAFSNVDYRNDNGAFRSGKAIYRGDHKAELTLFIPQADQTPSTTNQTKYYNKGIWMKYNSTESGYQMPTNNSVNDNPPGLGTDDGQGWSTYGNKFTAQTPGGYKFSITKHLEANKTYEFKIKNYVYVKDWQDQDKNEWYGYNENSNTITDSKCTELHFHEESDKKHDCGNAKIKTTAEGEYIFTIDLSKGKVLLSVEYPVAVGDYRVIYTDTATWSQGTAHGANWYHPSRIIKKNKANEPTKDIISFFISFGKNTMMRFQKVQSITNGNVTWEDAGEARIPDNIKEAGVYNFIVTQTANGESISMEDNAEPYTGNYYIRCDAVGGKWDNYKTHSENRMTYSAFSESKANSFGEKFSHYATKYCTNGTKIEFTIANDYSPCISDTLAQDITNPLDNLDSEGRLLNNDIYSANVRFMWNHKTNKISRAYVGPAADKQSQFLMLRTKDEIQGAAGELDPDEGDILDEENNIYAARFTDTQNWMYERTIRVKPGTRVKLYASYPKIYHIYIDNQTGWNDIALYAWKDSGDRPLGDWPGIKPTGTVVIEGKTYHDFQVNEWVFNGKLKLNNNNNGQDTNEYAIGSAGNYYLTAKNYQLSLKENGYKANVIEATAQYFRGAYDNNNATWDDNNSIVILGGSGTDWNTIRVIYDFKTNRLMAALVPDQEVSEEKIIAADVMIIRKHQENATCITLTNDNSKLTEVKTVYGSLQFNRWVLNNRDSEKSGIEFCTKKIDNQDTYDEEVTNEHHPILDPKDQKTIYDRALYFISFPFDVHLSDVFGFGTYGTHWVISTYNGQRRAQNGYFVDNCMNEDCTNWDYIWDPSDFTMKANQGYLLSLDLDLMKYNNTDFWLHNIDQVELFFPSTANIDTIERTNYTMPSLRKEDYECTINFNKVGPEDPTYNPVNDHRVRDSYWRCIGVPSFANYDGSLYKTEQDAENEENAINWKDSYTWQADNAAFPFLYEWQVTDNSLQVQNTRNFNFKATFAYLVQNGDSIYWSAVNAKPSNIVARKQEAKRNYDWKITIARNGKVEDQTFVRLSDNEKVTTEFDFNQDLSKEFNYGRSDIYTLIGYEKAAANSLPLSEQTTLIPLGLSIEYNGDYTIAMPDGTANIGVTLIDTESNTRTNLSAGMEYTLTLKKGDYNNRFFIEISPIQQTPTDIEYVENSHDDQARKVLIDNILYIVRDGQIFDARGARVK